MKIGKIVIGDPDKATDMLPTWAIDRGWRIVDTGLSIFGEYLCLVDRQSCLLHEFEYMPSLAEINEICLALK